MLTVGRYLGHWHTMTRTAKVERIQSMHAEPRLEVHPDDAKRFSLEADGIAAITSRRGTLTARITITDRIRSGSVFLPMHWGFTQEHACEANALMHGEACPISKQPELKATAVVVAPAVSVIRPQEQTSHRLQALRRLFSPAPR